MKGRGAIRKNIRQGSEGILKRSTIFYSIRQTDEEEECKEGAQYMGLDYVDSHADEIQNINMLGRAKGNRPNVIVHDCDLPHVVLPHACSV